MAVVGTVGRAGLGEERYMAGRVGKWVRRTAARLGLESSLRPVGQPRKKPEKKTNGF